MFSKYFWIDNSIEVINTEKAADTIRLQDSKCVYSSNNTIVWRKSLSIKMLFVYLNFDFILNSIFYINFYFIFFKPISMTYSNERLIGNIQFA